MGYELNATKSLSKDIERIVLEQVDKALDRLRSPNRNKDKAIHDARVCVKKIRTVLRLIRDSLGEDRFEEEDLAYRDIARLLSKVRDSTAMLDILNRVTAHFSDQLTADAFDTVKKRLQRSKSAQRKGAKRAMLEAAKSLRKARGRIDDWTKPKKRNSLTQGFRQTYERGRDTFKIALDELTVDSFHEWRKNVKYLLYQSRILTPLWTTMMTVLTAELDTLAEFLSEHHDLAILRDSATELLSKDNEVEIETLTALIDQRSNELEVKAKHLGAKIYAESPRAFKSRIEAYWKTLRDEVKDDAIATS